MLRPCRRLVARAALPPVMGYLEIKARMRVDGSQPSPEDIV
jgi:hypothetical protein